MNLLSHIQVDQCSFLLFFFLLVVLLAQTDLTLAVGHFKRGGARCDIILLLVVVFLRCMYTTTRQLPACPWWLLVQLTQILH